MIEKLNIEIKNAMKSKEKEKLQAFRYLKSLLMENRVSKSPKDEMDIVISHIKKLKDSLSTYPEGNEQIITIQSEINTLSIYLPQQLSEEDVVTLISEIVKGLDSPQMGLVMKSLSPQIKGKFDGKRASALVREALA
jgi:uncharacterized protein YqeY